MSRSVPSSERDATLRVLLSDRARHASDARLALDVGVGIVACVAALVWRPGPWHLLLAAALCLASFGAWGIADREIRERAADDATLSRRLLLGVRVLAVVIGTLGALLLVFGTLAFALGTWIS